MIYNHKSNIIICPYTTLFRSTANIDTETEVIIQEALEVLKKDRTTLVIAHRLSTIQQADIIFVLERGMIKEEGNHGRSEEHTSELQSRGHLVCRLLLEKKKQQ